MPWTCNQCDSENELGFNVCLACSAPRPGAEPPYEYKQYRKVERSFSDDLTVEQTVLIVRPAIQKLETASETVWWSVPIVFAFVCIIVTQNLLWGTLVGLAVGVLASYLLSVVIDWMICIIFLLETNPKHLTTVDDAPQSDR